MILDTLNNITDTFSLIKTIKLNENYDSMGKLSPGTVWEINLQQFPVCIFSFRGLYVQKFEFLLIGHFGRETGLWLITTHMIRIMTNFVSMYD